MWKHRITIKHLFTKKEDHESIQRSMNAIADVLDEDSWFSAFKAKARFRMIPRGDGVIVPVDYSNFTPGVYTTTVPSFIFNSFTETLTVGPVPEPSALAMAGLGGACLLLSRRRRH